MAWPKPRNSLIWIPFGSQSMDMDPRIAKNGSRLRKFGYLGLQIRKFSLSVGPDTANSLIWGSILGNSPGWAMPKYRHPFRPGVLPPTNKHKKMSNKPRDVLFLTKKKSCRQEAWTPSSVRVFTNCHTNQYKSLQIQIVSH